MEARTAFRIVAVLGFLASAVPEARSEVATQEEARLACQNWLSHIVNQRGSWAGEVEPEIVDVQQIIAEDGDTLLAHCFSIGPRGYVVVPILKELPPIKAYSEEYGLNGSQTVGFPELLREVLEHRIGLFVKEYGSMEASQPASGDVLFDRVNRRAWRALLVDADQYRADLDTGGPRDGGPVGPLLTTDWHQSGPYNNQCPMGDGGRTVVGCVATAAAQIMRYYQWPPYGEGDHTYWWDGDDSCGGSTSGASLYADFSDSYDWANMPNDCDGGCTSAQQNALAELCYEVGVAFEMDYGNCGSGTQTYYALDVFPTYFRYSTAIDKEDRDDHTAAAWFGLIQDEINASRPIQYRISGHSVVCDGWWTVGTPPTEQDYYHINYGWGGSHTTWFAIDNIYGSSDPMVEYLIRNIEPIGGPINDDCDSAAEVGNGTFEGTTAFATNDGSASCGLSSSSPDVWYSYCAMADGTLEVNTCGSSFNTVLSVHSGCPGTPANELDCNDDSNNCGVGSDRSYVSVPVSTTTTYYIRVSGHNGDSGDYSLYVD
ncbi:MAG: C10 family peptidase, partial [Planctomycetota bacterium]